MFDLMITLEKTIYPASGYSIEDDFTVLNTNSSEPSLIEIFGENLNPNLIYIRPVNFLSLAIKMIVYVAYNTTTSQWVITGDLEELPANCGTVTWEPFYLTSKTFSELTLHTPLLIGCAKVTPGYSEVYTYGFVSGVQKPVSVGEMRILLSDPTLTSEGMIVSFSIEETDYMAIFWEDDGIQMKVYE